MSQDDKEELESIIPMTLRYLLPTQTLDCIWAEPGTDRYHSPGCIYVPGGTPGCQVELIDGQITSGSTTVSDTIRAPQYRAFRGGNGADLLVLDSLPAESYIEKGFLRI